MKRVFKVFIFIFSFVIVLFILNSIVDNILRFEKIRSAFNENKSKPLLVDSLNVFNYLGSSKTITFKSDSTYVLHFWATWCKPCIEKMKNAKDTSGKSFYITLEDSVTLKEFVKKNNFKFELLRIDSLSLPFNPKKINIYPTRVTIKNDSCYFKTE